MKQIDSLERVRRENRVLNLTRWFGTLVITSITITLAYLFAYEQSVWAGLVLKGMYGVLGLSSVFMIGATLLLKYLNPKEAVELKQSSTMSIGRTVIGYIGACSVAGAFIMTDCWFWLGVWMFSHIAGMWYFIAARRQQKAQSSAQSQNIVAVCLVLFAVLAFSGCKTPPPTTTTEYLGRVADVRIVYHWVQDDSEVTLVDSTHIIVPTKFEHWRAGDSLYVQHITEYDPVGNIHSTHSHFELHPAHK